LLAGHITTGNEHLILETADVAAPSGNLVLTQVKDGVALLTLNSPPVNALSPQLLQALEKAYTEAANNSSVKAIVITGKGKFCGGADITSFSTDAKATEASNLRTHNFFNTMESGSKPVVAAIDGFALGGGLELAMSTHARVITPTTSLGLPELNLGIIPGYGGTQRLPRLVGVQKAVEMILKSAPVKAKEALEIELVDAVVPREQLLQEAGKKALELSAKPESLRRSLRLEDKIDKETALQILGFASKQVSKIAKNVPHPKAALAAIQEGIENGPERGLERERKEILKMMGTPTTQALISFFFATKSTTKVPGVTDKGLKPRDIKTAAVIGGGTMGSGIITALIFSGITTYLKEINQNFWTKE